MLTWSLYHLQCKACGTTKTKHHARGLCTACYQLQYKRKPRPNKALEDAKEASFEYGKTHGRDQVAHAATDALEQFGLGFAVSNNILYISTPEGQITRKLGS